MITADGVRRLVYVPELRDDEIEAYADDGFSENIDVAIAICDYMATRTSGASKTLKVGPITIDKASSSQNWQQIKDNLIKRKNLGAGVPGGGIGLAGLVTFGGVVLSGQGLSEPVYVGQFDNPPRSGDSE